MQKHVNLVDLAKSFPTNIFLPNLASMQQRTSLIKFAHLAEKSEKGSVSNLSAKVNNDDSCIDAGGDARPHQFRYESLLGCVCVVCDVHDRSVVASIPLPSA